MESTKEKIFKYITKKGKTRAEEIRQEFGLGRSIIHRHLLSLLDENKIIKIGKAPIVYYFSKHLKPILKSELKITPVQKDFIEKKYLYASPSGKLMSGVEGFNDWVINIKQDKYIQKLAEEYIHYRKNADKLFNSINVLDATNKLKNTFEVMGVDKVFFADFYSLPKFGKTKLGQKLLYAKQAQVQKLMKEISQEVFPLLKNIITKYKIDTITFVPPTIPRNLQFLKEFEKYLKLSLPKIKLIKAYSGDVPIAQKTLNKLEERIQNARDTIFIKDNDINFKNILIIDDAIGSGATINEIALKFKKINSKGRVFGFGVVGSFKGFDVISEV